MLRLPVLTAPVQLPQLFQQLLSLGDAGLAGEGPPDQLLFLDSCLS